VCVKGWEAWAVVGWGIVREEEPVISCLQANRKCGMENMLLLQQ